MKLEKFENVLFDKTSLYTKIPKEFYLNEGMYRVIDQGKEFIGGFTNDNTQIYTHNSPVIIFGDHTKVLKYIDFPFAIGADGVKVLHLDSEKANTKFVYFFLKSVKLTDAGYSRHFKFLKEVKIPLPPLVDQIRIAEILSQAEALIAQRKESIGLLDAYLKSTFLEMFGDPVRNEKEWDMDIIENNSVKISSGSTPLGGREVYQREGILFIRSQNVRMNRLDYSDIYCISKEIHNNMKRTWIKNEDVLMNITGASIGRVATYYGKDDNANVNQHVCIIRTIKDRLNPRFLEYQIANDHYQKVSISASTGGTRESFTFEMIKKFKIIVPSIDLQTKFAKIVKKVEVLKSEYQESLLELQNMYCVLSQKAFKGELIMSKPMLNADSKAEEVEDDYFKKRQTLANFIINQSLDDEQFGDVKFQKLLHLSDYAILKRNLNQKYYQKSAGPFDNTFTMSFIEEIEKKKWFVHKKTGLQSIFKPGEKHKESLNINGYLSQSEMDGIKQLINHFKFSNYEDPEIISTLYAVWNNRIIKKQPITDELLKDDFLKWDEKKAKYKKHLDKGLAWMRKNDIVPDGWGKVIEKPKGK